ncbi:LPXTG cell wall anchor domain-containing protein, partial [Enterococcus faecalis]|uniref:Rib/alpha-like domain-containing protein n=1 Tax=Enterococcus faecalis TaxID=1351 RepID=UPI001363D290
FANASPRPIVVRYVLQLTKPLDEILDEMKAVDKIEENEPFGKDFIFASWLSDTNKKLIQNTYGTGYYYLQDIDGDGNPDDKEESGDTNPYIGKPELEEVYDVDTTVKGKVFIHELAGTGHKAQLVDKEGNVLAEKTIAPNEKDGATVSDTVEFEFTGVDSSKLIAKDELKIQIVSPGFDKPEEGSTIIKESPKAVDKQTVVVGFKPDAKESIRNNKNLPEDAKYSWKTDPDTSKVTDSTKGVVTVTLGNRIFDVDVEFAVKSSQALENNAMYDAIETQPETIVQSGKPKFDKEDVPLANNPFTIGDAFDKSQGEATINPDTGEVTFLPAKGVGEDKPTKVTIPVSITYEDGSVGKTELIVTVGKDIIENPGANIPEGYHKVTFTAGEGTSIESGTTVFAVKDGVSLPEDKLPVLKAEKGYTDAKWPAEATQPITTDDTEFVSSVTKLEDKTDADKYEPTVEGEKVELGGTYDLTDNVTNLPDLPEGTTVKDVTPEGTIDTNTPGNYEGVIEVVYPDGTKDTVKVPVEVTDNRSDADKYNPIGQNITTNINKAPDAADGINNKSDLPKGTTYSWKEEVDVSTIGNKKGIVVVTYPDKTTEEVEVTVFVVDNKAPNKPQVDPITDGDKIVTGKTEPNADVTVTLPDGSEYHGTADENGNFKINVPELEEGTKVRVTATDESGNTSEPTYVGVSSGKGNPSNSGNPSNGDKSSNRGGKTNTSSAKAFPKTGEIDSSIFIVSGGLILLGTLGLLGYRKRRE